MYEREREKEGGRQEGGQSVGGVFYKKNYNENMRNAFFKIAKYCI
jgi:hypothetical protein